MPSRRFSWDGNLIAVRSLITQYIHNPTPCCLIWASLTTSSKEIYTYGSFFKSLKSQVSVACFHLSRHLVPSLLSRRLLALLTSGACCEGDLGKKKGRTCSLNPSPRVWSLWGSLVGVYERPCPMLYLPCYLHLFLDEPAHVPCSLTTRSWRA